MSVSVTHQPKTRTETIPGSRSRTYVSTERIASVPLRLHFLAARQLQMIDIIPRLTPAVQAWLLDWSDGERPRSHHTLPLYVTNYGPNSLYRNAALSHLAPASRFSIAGCGGSSRIGRCRAGPVGAGPERLLSRDGVESWSHSGA